MRSPPLCLTLECYQAYIGPEQDAVVQRFFFGSKVERYLGAKKDAYLHKDLSQNIADSWIAEVEQSCIRGN